MALVLLFTSLLTIIDILCEKCITLKARFGKAYDHLNLFSLLNLPQLLYVFLLIFVYRFRSKINCIGIFLCDVMPGMAGAVKAPTCGRPYLTPVLGTSQK